MIETFSIFVVRTIGVAIGTMRIAAIAKKRPVMASMLGFVEQIAFIWTSATVILDIGNVFNIVAYAGGFAMGTLIGCIVEPA